MRSLLAVVLAAFLARPCLAEEPVEAAIRIEGSEVRIAFGASSEGGRRVRLHPSPTPCRVEDDRVLVGRLVTLYFEGEAPRISSRPEDVRPAALRKAPLEGEPPRIPESGWAFTTPPVPVRGRNVRALHARLEKPRADGEGEAWTRLEVVLHAGSAQEAEALARSLRTSPLAGGVPLAARAAGARAPDPRSAARGHLLRIAGSGVYAVTPRDLGRSEPVFAGTVSLMMHGAPVPFWFEPAEDGLLEPDDAIFFYAEPAPNLYAPTTAVWISFEAGPGEPVARRIAAPACPDADTTAWVTVAREEDREYWLGLPPGEGADRWFWNRLRDAELYSRPLEDTFVLDPPPAGPGRLTVDLQGKTTGNHDVLVTLVSGWTGSVMWQGARARSATFGLSPEALVAGPNGVAFSVDLSGGVDLLYLNRYAVTYEAALRLASGSLAFEVLEAGCRAIRGAGGDLILLDVTDPASPVLLEGFAVEDGEARFEAAAGARYAAVAPESVRRPERIDAADPVELPQGADYLAIVPAPFRDAVEPLLAHHRSRGLEAVSVDPEAVYLAFGFGEPSPSAIHDFLAHAYASWSPVPFHVLLVGDATVDFRNLLGLAPDPSLPTLLVHAPGFGEIGSDNALGDVAGGDAIPEFALGRIPGRTAEEVRRVVDRTLAYEAAFAPPGDAWRRRVHLVTDDGSEANPFEAVAEGLAAMFQPAYAVERSYLSAIGSITQTRAVVKERLDAGSLLAIYAGHGNTNTWAAERILHVDDALALANGARLPVVVTLNCLNGYHMDAEEPHSLAEAFVLAPEGGAVGTWAPSGLGYLFDEATMVRSWIEELVVEGGRDAGEAILAAKTRARLHPGIASSHEMLQSYTWFGDPALRLTLPSPPRPEPPAADATLLGVWLRWPSGERVRIVREDTGEIASLTAEDASWLDDSVSSGTAYRYAIASENEAGFTSPASEWVAVTAGELSGDGAPPAIAVEGASCLGPGDRVRVAITDPDGVVCGEIEVSLDGEPLPPSAWALNCPAIGIAEAVSLTLAASWPAGPHSVLVASRDGAGTAGSTERIVEGCSALRALAAAVSPNPAPDAVLVSVALTRPAPLSVLVLDAAGKRIREIASPAAPEHAVTWDGRTEAGAQVASGVYFLRLSAAAQAERWETTRKVVLAR